MLLTAVLYDVHGNHRALEAVVQDAQAAGAERFVLGGDYALFGPEPRETVRRLQALGRSTWIRGNVDRWCAHPDQAGDDELLQRAISDCRAALGEELTRQLGALPEGHVEDGIRFCHASPASDMQSFLPQPAGSDDELLQGVEEMRVVFGHTHVQFRRTRTGGIELVNPGSVGMPLDGDHRAAYALLRHGELELRRVAYDHEAAAAAMRRHFGDADWAARSERRLLSAQA